MDGIHVLKTHEEFVQFFKEFPIQKHLKVILDSLIPAPILEKPDLYEIWKSRAQEICEGKTTLGGKAQTLLFNFFSPLSKIPENSFITLHVRDTLFPIQFLKSLGLETRVGTIRYEFSERSKVGPYVVKYPDFPLPVERIIMDYGSYIDCTDMVIDQLVLYTLLCGRGFEKAKEIKSMIIVHPFNILPDGEIYIPASEKKFDVQINGFPVPSPPGLIRLVIPEAQEFRYDVRETVLPDIIGILPSLSYPSRISFGIKSSRHPFEKSNLPSEISDLYDNPPETKTSVT